MEIASKIFLESDFDLKFTIWPIFEQNSYDVSLLKVKLRIKTHNRVNFFSKKKQIWKT